MTIGTRTLGYLALQALLGLIGWAYLVLAIAAAALMVLIVGLPVALVVVLAGRELARAGLAVSRWLVNCGQTPTIQPLPVADGLLSRAKALSDPAIWRIQAWHAFNALTVPVTFLAVFLLPVAVLWEGVHLRVTWFLLAPQGASLADYSVEPTAPDLAVASTRSRTSTFPLAGHGLVGMRERTVALGGSFSAAPTADGGYRVQAVLPTDH